MMFLECFLCKCQLPDRCDELFTSHLKMQHRTFSNHVLLFKLSQLDQSGLDRTLEIVNEILSGNIVENLDPDMEESEEFISDQSEIVKIQEKSVVDESESLDPYTECTEEVYLDPLELVGTEEKCDEKEMTKLERIKTEPEDPKNIIYSKEETQFIVDQLIEHQLKGYGLTEEVYPKLIVKLAQKFPGKPLPSLQAVTVLFKTYKRQNIMKKMKKIKSMKKTPIIKPEFPRKKISDPNVEDLEEVISDPSELVKVNKKYEVGGQDNLNLKEDNDNCPMRDEASKPKWTHYTVEQKQFCVDYLEIVEKNGLSKMCGRGRGWHKEFVASFLLKFPECKNVPDKSTVRRIQTTFAKYNTLEYRYKGNCGRQKSESQICDICGYVGNGKRQDITRHKKRVHTEKKACATCGKMISALQWRAHLKEAHIPESEMKYNCSFCGKGCVTKQKLREHELIHGDERPFSCKFSLWLCLQSSANLSKHEKICSLRN